MKSLHPRQAALNASSNANHQQQQIQQPLNSSSHHQNLNSNHQHPNGSLSVQNGQNQQQQHNQLSQQQPQQQHHAVPGLQPSSSMKAQDLSDYDDIATAAVVDPYLGFTTHKMHLQFRHVISDFSLLKELEV